jgi:PBSX family phage terminase large subunit
MKLTRLSEKQGRSIVQATHWVNLWHGAVRSGKTTASLLWFASQIEQHDGIGDLLMVGKTERTLKRNLIRPMEDLLGHEVVSLREGSGEARIMGQRVYLVGANDERAEQKIRGGTFARIYGDEVSLWPKSFFDMALTRMSTPGAKFGGTTNPDAPRHWLKKEYIDREGEMDLLSFHFKLTDNPDLSASYVDNLKRSFTGMWYKRFIEGLWVVAEGVIWDAFDTDQHCMAEVPEGVKFDRYFVAIDYGTSNPFVALLFGVDTEGVYWVLDEWRWDSRARNRQMSDQQYSAAMAEWIATHEGIVPTAWYPDPSAASFILQMTNDHPWSVNAADNDVEDGLRTVATAFGSDKIRIIMPNCESTVDECLGYSWDPKKQRFGKDEPIKQDDHGPDALRYGVLSDRRQDIGDFDQYGWAD